MHVESIDKTNRDGYDAIASEFDDRRRPTTANFHELSQRFLQQTLAQYKSGARVLEIGPGTGFATELLSSMGFELSLLELSGAMVDELRSRFRYDATIEVGSILCPPKLGLFDLVLCSLADPYLTLEALVNISRLLTSGGDLLLTTPSRVWAEAVRKQLAFTEFTKEDGTAIKVHSFLYSNYALQALIEEAGFQIVDFKVARGADVKTTPLSKVLTDAAEILGIEVGKLEILQLVHARKPSLEPIDLAID